MAFEARAPRFRDRVERSFAAQGFMAHLGAELASIEPGRVEIRLPFRTQLTQQHGFFHGGATATLADNASGFAAFTLMTEAEQPLSVEFKVNLVAKGDGDVLVCVGEVLKDGRTLKVCRAEVFVERDGMRTLCATALATIMAVEAV